MTAAYMTRCVYLTFFGEPRGHAADKEHPPHESGPRIVVPLYILSGLAIVGGFANLPGLLLAARRVDAAVRALLRAQGPLLPVGPQLLRPPRVQHLDRAGRRRPSACSASVWPTAGTSGASARTGSPSAAGWPAPATASSCRSTTSTGSTRTSSSARSRAPSPAPPTGSTRRASTASSTAPAPWPCGAASSSTTRSTRAWSTRWSTAPGAAAEGSGQALRFMQTGRVQQYAALLFAATAVLAAIFIIVI